MSKIQNPAFAQHFKKLINERNLERSDFCGKNVPADRCIAGSTFDRAARGEAPERHETIKRFAKILKITPQEFISPPKELDWVHHDVKEFIGAWSVKVIDGAIMIHKGPEQSNQRDFWHLDDMVFEIDKKPFTLNELEPFKNVIEEWQKLHPDAKRGMKFCVTEAIRTPGENNSKLVLKVRPIEYHLVKPINDKITLKFFPATNTYSIEADGSAMRQKYFPKILARDELITPNILTAQVAVVTSDNKLLLCKRRAKYVDSFNGCWSASFEEGFNADWHGHLPEEEVLSPLKAPDLSMKGGFLRALREELCLTPELIVGTNIQGLGFIVEYANLNTVLAAIANVPISAEELLANDELLSHEEVDCFAYCPFDLHCLGPALLDKKVPPQYVISPGKNPTMVCDDWTWHPTSRMRIFLSLVNHYGWNAVTTHINRELKKEAHIA